MIITPDHTTVKSVYEPAVFTVASSDGDGITEETSVEILDVNTMQVIGSKCFIQLPANVNVSPYAKAIVTVKPQNVMAAEEAFAMADQHCATVQIKVCEELSATMLLLPSRAQIAVNQPITALSPLSSELRQDEWQEYCFFVEDGLTVSAAAVDAFAQSHPSDSTIPSHEDMAMTKNIQKGCEAVDIQLVRPFDCNGRKLYQLCGRGYYSLFLVEISEFVFKYKKK